jgi:hypothetical protein
MAEEDTWPLPDYNPGPRDHVHALGVIALQFASFERSVDFLYLHRTGREKLPDELVHLYYFSLSEDKRIDAIKAIFNAFETDTSIKSAVFNLLEYFEWCRNCRNQLLHAELHPTTFSRLTGALHLTKRVSKQSAKSGYLRLSLSEMRIIADRMRQGVKQAAEIHIFLRYRGRPKETLPTEYQAFVEELPGKLVVPRKLELALIP